MSEKEGGKKEERRRKQEEGNIGKRKAEWRNGEGKEGK